MSTHRRRRHVKINSRQAGYVVAALLIMVVAGRAGGAAAATWWDALAVGVAVSVLSIAVAWPKPRRRAPVKGRSILSAEVRRQRRTDNQVLAGRATGGAVPAAPAGGALVVTSGRAPRAHVVIATRLAVAEELLAVHGLTADYRHMVSAVEQDAEADQARAKPVG